MNHSEERCRTFHVASELSFFTTSVSIALFISTTLLNGLIILLFIRNQKFLHKSMYYKVLLNISIADFLTGLISDTTSISFHLKEGLWIHISKEETRLLHCSLFLINTASVLNIAIFCIDRVMLLCRPLTFRNGMKDWQAACILVLPWLSAAGLLLPYFYVGYIRYLKIFCFVAVSLTCICLIVLIISYRIRLSQHLTIDGTSLRIKDKLGRKRSYTLESGSSLTSTTDDGSMRASEGTGSRIKLKWEIGGASCNEQEANNEVNTNKNKIFMTPRSPDKLDISCPWYCARNCMDSKESTANNNKPLIKDFRRGTSCYEDEYRRKALTEKRVNKTFITMLLVYLGAYLPSAIMTVYVNTCFSCSCTLVHVLRDLIYLSILSSAFWRPLNFILRLNTLKHETKKLMKSVTCKWSSIVRSISCRNKSNLPATFSNECFINSGTYTPK